MRSAKKRAELGELAALIESEMRRIGRWLEQPPSEPKVLEGGAFGMGSVTFDTWLQVVFVTRLRQVAAGNFPLPDSSSVGAQAAREWDGDRLDRRHLLELIGRVDALLR